jgi:hypothetical protein
MPDGTSAMAEVTVDLPKKFDVEQLS